MALLASTAPPYHLSARAADNPIVAENKLAGDPTWNQFSTVIDQLAISGYGSKISANRGETIDFFVTTRDSTVNIDIYRAGYYAGAGARKVLSLGSFPGQLQAIPPPDPTTGMIAASWNKTASLTIPTTWVTGVYLAKLTGSPSGRQSFIFFVVRNDGGNESYVIQTSVTTYQAYNLYGGTSLYGNATDLTVFPYQHATKVSFDRPFDPLQGQGTGDFLKYEYPLVRWAESQGYDLTYITDVDTHTNVNPLTNHRAFLAVGHDEYWSREMRQNLTAARDAGVNLGFFTADTGSWQIRFEPNAAGAPNRVEVGYKNYTYASARPGPDPLYCPLLPCAPGTDNTRATAMWRNWPISQPEQDLLGVMSEGVADGAYVVQNASNSVYAGTGLTEGSAVSNLVGYEYDRVFTTYVDGITGNTITPALPPGLTTLSNSPLGTSHANSTIYTVPSGARVFAAGTIKWSAGLDSSGYGCPGGCVSPAIRRMTANILNSFGSGASVVDHLRLTAPVQALSGRSFNVTVAAENAQGGPVAGYSGTLHFSTGDSGTGVVVPPDSRLIAGDGTFSVTLATVGPQTLTVSDAANALSATANLTVNAPPASGPPPSMPVISRNVPAYATNIVYPANYGNDADYGTRFQGTPPTYLAYDLSAVPAASRGQVLVAWYNEGSPWDAQVVNRTPYNEPRDYTIEANAAPGGGGPPAGGWTTLLTVTGNFTNSRLHALNLSGFNWLRMSVTAVNGATGNLDAAFNLDIHDASRGTGDAWFFFGDSLTENGMGHHEPNNFAQQINAAQASYFPAQQDAGISGWNASCFGAPTYPCPFSIDARTGQQYFAEYLAAFPGRFVSIALGTNDANQNASPATYKANMAAMIEQVLSAGKTPVVPLIPWGCTPSIQANGPTLNAAIRELWTAYPAVVHGPDFWTYFQSNPGLIDSDCMHPTFFVGADAYRALYAQTMLTNAYNLAPPPPPVVDHLKVTAPATVTAGAPFSVTVRAEDSQGGLVSGYTGTVHFSTTDSGSGVALPADSTLTSGQGSFSATLATAAPQTLTVSDAAHSLSTTVSLIVNGQQGSANHLVVATTATPTAGAAFSFTVTAQDQSGNTDPAYAGTVHFTSSDTSAGVVLPANATLTNGQGTFSAALIRADAETITATDTVTASITGTLSVTTRAAPANHLTLTSATSTPTPGVAFSFTVIAQDQYGNTDPAYAGTVHFTSTDSSAGASLPADTSLSSGQGTYSATLTAAGAQTITARDTVTASITGGLNVSVRAASANHLVLNTATSTPTAGAAFSFTVTAQDPYGNTDPAYAGTVHFTSTDTAAGVLLPADTTLSSGQGTYSATLIRAGGQTITARDTVTASISGPLSVSVRAAPANHLTLTSATSTPTAGAAFSLTVAAQDQYGNTDLAYGGRVHFTSTDTAAGVLLPADTTLSSGQGTYSATLIRAGGQTITARDTVTASITGGVSVTTRAAPANHLTLSSTTSTPTAGVAFSVTVIAQDQYGNTDLAYGGRVHFTSTDTAAGVVLPADTTLTSGQGTYSATLVRAGAQTITARDTVTASITGGVSVTVLPASAATLTLATPSSVTATQPFSATVTLTDRFGNLATGYRGTVHFTSSDMLATLPPDYTFTAADAARHTFSVTLATPLLTQTVTVTDVGNASLTATNSITVNQLPVL